MSIVNSIRKFFSKKDDSADHCESSEAMVDVKLELERKHGHFWFAWTEHPVGEHQSIDIQWMDGPTKDAIMSELLSSLSFGRTILPQLSRRATRNSLSRFGDSWRSTPLPIVTGAELVEELEHYKK